MNPRVSVVVTTYNQAPYIESALASVLGQTYAPYEVIVVDDGSTDDTWARIAGFRDRITYVRQRNGGIASSRNTGILRARGELIAFLDGDDLWEPRKLEIQVDEAMKNPRSGLIVADGVQFDDGGITARTLFFGPGRKEMPGEGAAATRSCYRLLLRGPFISTTSQVMVPARVFRAVGLSNGRFTRANDYDLYIRIAARFDVTLIGTRLTRWRLIPTSASGPKELRFFRYLPEDIAVLKGHESSSAGNDRALIRETVREKLFQGAEMLYYHGRNTDRIAATTGLFRLLTLGPFSMTVAARLLGLWCPQSLVTRLKKPLRALIARGRERAPA